MARLNSTPERWGRDVNITFNDLGGSAEIRFEKVCLARSEDRENLADVFDKFVDYMKNGDSNYYKPEHPGEIKTIMHALCYERNVKLF